jgi:serine/threonine-protein kinase
VSPASAPSPIAAGTLIAERYRVISVLGEGGMGIVYLAEHVHMRKRAAIKVLLPQWTSTSEVVARFEREAVAAGAITHPNVAAATDFGRLADGSFFLVLEYLEGRTLRSELEAGALSPVRALTIARGIALGVAAAHAKGIVHRDLKPENVMLVQRDGDPDFVKVLDFGIARVEARVASDGQVLTSAGAILGTPDYMAPEQALGGSIDARADVYSLGVMLFEMLTGECPFGGGAVTLLRQHILTPAPPVPDVVAVPAETRALVARLLEKEAGARYASAMDVVPVIEQCLGALGPTRPAPAVVLSSSPMRSFAGAAAGMRARVLAVVRRRPRLVVLAGVALSLIVTVVASSSDRDPAFDALAPSAAESAAPSAIPPPEAPSASATPEAIASASPAKAAPPPAAPAHERHAARRTGPGGLYIPPPSRWFK